MGRKAFVFDIAKCTGCGCCQFACKDEHCDNDWSPIAKPQPDIGQFWIKVNDYLQGTKPKVKVHYIPEMCNHCEHPACIAAAKDGAVYQREDGIVIIDPEKAAGQRQIMEACPYGAIYWNEKLDIPQKCTGCAHLLDNGVSLPRCVENCPTEALVFGDVDELEELVTGANVLKPETGCGPQVYYRNIPGKFIAGTLVDPVADEVVSGANVRAITGGKLYKTVSDNYGDFWFKDLPVGVFDVYIEAKNFKVKKFEHLRTLEAINLGDIMLEKE